MKLCYLLAFCKKHNLSPCGREETERNSTRSSLTLGGKGCTAFHVTQVVTFSFPRDWKDGLENNPKSLAFLRKKREDRWIMKWDPVGSHSSSCTLVHRWFKDHRWKQNKHTHSHPAWPSDRDVAKELAPVSLHSGRKNKSFHAN